MRANHTRTHIHTVFLVWKTNEVVGYIEGLKVGGSIFI